MEVFWQGLECLVGCGGSLLLTSRFIAWSDGRIARHKEEQEAARCAAVMWRLDHNARRTRERQLKIVRDYQAGR